MDEKMKMEKLKKVSEKEIAKSVVKATENGFNITATVQAHIANGFDQLFNDKFYMKENSKTDKVPVFNLPNIMVQREFLKVYKNNKKKFDALVPVDERENFEDFVEYLQNNPMCVNCGSCMENCYNNKAYTQYPLKAICDLRQLYRLLKNQMGVVGDIVQYTINSKNARLNGSGEIHNEFILDTYVKIARLNPDTKYYTYTKNYKLLANRKLPKNLIVNLSDFGTTELILAHKDSFEKKINVFKVVSPEEFEKLESEGCKTLCYGVSCSTCRLCTKKSGITIYCAEH